MELITPGYGLLIWQLSGLIYLGFWAYALFDCVRSDFRGPKHEIDLGGGFAFCTGDRADRVFGIEKRI